ncbi:sec-independent translocase [Streptomyces sp. RY43-2]|uniref:Sec-independent translocase n=1 Tax=Streptomyces macrolidinus TaxID=2952607 RepID=A0ABT0ZN18_9ACTN|nr:sec-independent translocase [Streptomyces macrolidinus]MCN9244975.1 sec-independent translocase [Streptomyces macrolidinus]
MFSDVGPLELVTLAVLATLLFGPDKLPEIIQNVAGFLRKVRELSESTKDEIRSELGPEFKDFEYEDLHPKRFVRKHVLDGDTLGLDEIRATLDPRAELAQAADAVREAADDTPGRTAAPKPVPLTKDTQTGSPSRATFDPDAT